MGKLWSYHLNPRSPNSVAALTSKQEMVALMMMGIIGAAVQNSSIGASVDLGAGSGLGAAFATAFEGPC